MTSGVDWVEDHRDPDGPATALVAAFADAAARPAPCSTRVGARYPPGTRYAYCTADSQVLDWVRERATGRRLPRRRWPSCGATWAAPRTPWSPSTATGWRWPAAAWPRRRGDWARVGLLQVDGAARAVLAGWVSCPRPSLPFLRPGRLPAPLSAHPGSATTGGPSTTAAPAWPPTAAAASSSTSTGPRRAVVVKTSAWPYADAAHDARCRDLSYRTLSHAATIAHGKGGTVNRKVIITCALTGAGDTVAQVRARARDTAADRRVRHRGRPGGCRHRARARARPAQRRRLPRGGALPRGRRADPGQRRRRRDQHDRGHGRRPLPRPATTRPGSPRAPTWSAASTRLAHVEELLPGHLHARLRQPELRRGQPGLREHPGHAARGRQADPGAGGAARAGDLRHRAPVVRQQARRRGPGRRPADVPAVHGHPLRRPARARPCSRRWCRRCRPGVVWTSFAIGRMQMPWVAQSVLLGGHVRVGLEDNLYLGRGNTVTTPTSSPTPSRSSRRWAPRWPRRTRRGRSSRCGRAR